MRKIIFSLFVALLVNCDSKKNLVSISISDPYKFLDGHWCHAYDIHKCVRFKNDTVFQLKDYYIYDKTPFNEIEFDSLKNTITYIPHNKEYMILIEKLAKENPSRLDGVIVGSKITIIDSNYIIMADHRFGDKFPFENNYLFKRLSSLSSDERNIFD